MLAAMARWLALRGRDYPRLGPWGAAELPDGGALALSRGAYRKAYAIVDPNEDGALLYRADAGDLICVVDGYNGVRASEAALDAVCAHAVRLISASDSEFPAAVAAVTRSTANELAGERRSRSCLMFATLVEGWCRFVGFGDSNLFRASEMEPQNCENDLIIGPELREPLLPPEHWMGSFRCSPGERIAVVTDGITNFVPDATEIHNILAHAADDAAAATTLVRKAMVGGAGDNVAVATLSA